MYTIQLRLIVAWIESCYLIILFLFLLLFFTQLDPWDDYNKSKLWVLENYLFLLVSVIYFGSLQQNYKLILESIVIQLTRNFTDGELVG